MVQETDIWYRYMADIWCRRQTCDDDDTHDILTRHILRQKCDDDR